MNASETFLRNMSDIRQRARLSMKDGAVTRNYQGDLDEAVAMLNHAVATEIVCILRYKFHAITATGIASELVRAEFAQHAIEEGQHLDQLATRISQLGGKPNLNPEGLLGRASSEYVEGSNLTDMIRENLIAERVAVEIYRGMVRYFGEKDPTTRMMLEGILAKEEEHASDMHDLLVTHDPRPRLDR